MENMALRPQVRFHPTPDFWRNRRVLVTGHTGFKGGWLTLWLSLLGAKVCGLALPPEGRPNFFEAIDLASLCVHRLGDICVQEDVAAAMRASDPEIVFHLAAQSLVRRSYRDPVLTIATNVMGTTHLLEACRTASRIQGIVVLTSDKVYENRERNEPYREDEPLGGHDPYAASKACADLIATSYRRAFLAKQGPPSVALATARAGNVIGGGDWAEDRLLPDLVRAFSTGTIAKIRAPQAVRPWQHVVDVTRGYLMLAQALTTDSMSTPSAVNFGPISGTATVGNIADGFTRAWGNGTSWQTVPDLFGAHEATMLAVDPSVARHSLGWECKIPLHRALEMTASWYRHHAAGASPLKLREFTLTQIADAGCEAT
jgi:CDP-glucose 4,6-dehydratase